MDIPGLAYAFINTPGVGGVIIMLVFGTAVVLYYLLTRWIIAGGESETNRSSEEHEV